MSLRRCPPTSQQAGDIRLTTEAFMSQIASNGQKFRSAKGRAVSGLPLAAVIYASTAATLSKAEAAGDAAAGQQVFARCAVCHSAKAGENKIGPSLFGVFGRKSGTAPGYDYSPAMKTAGIT